MRQLRKTLTNKEKFTLHDLRRTVRTALSRLGVADETAEMVIGHMPQGVRKVYDMHDRLDERKEGLNRWAEHVLKLAGHESNVMEQARAPSATEPPADRPAGIFQIAAAPVA